MSEQQSKSKFGIIGAVVGIVGITGGVVFFSGKQEPIPVNDLDKQKLLKICMDNGKSESDCTKVINENFDELKENFLKK